MSASVESVVQNKQDCPERSLRYGVVHVAEKLLGASAEANRGDRVFGSRGNIPRGIGRMFWRCFRCFGFPGGSGRSVEMRSPIEGTGRLGCRERTLGSGSVTGEKFDRKLFETASINDKYFSMRRLGEAIGADARRELRYRVSGTG
ncbi:MULTISPECIES: hypothetical protein [unclassified Coleofasciculus]|uniref:hypothetical protein n=1 Tax=unclassified Coleofasciculus TaxID=2692782 RepID=UPI00188068C3|nr:MULTISPECIES: hypothetical protein [unclassified Coleofasciculus]MBE9128194.1 hypothetical protein [Coleofasciculus sp. LEGE 07081]MBE9151264.1 hypothetical protein [Coleofasciculus sp. LEGE 07092]